MKERSQRIRNTQRRRANRERQKAPEPVNIVGDGKTTVSFVLSEQQTFTFQRISQARQVPIGQILAEAVMEKLNEPVVDPDAPSNVIKIVDIGTQMVQDSQDLPKIPDMPTSTVSFQDYKNSRLR